MLQRRYFRDNIQLSILGMGGFVVVGQPQEEADRLVSEAVAEGVNYFDVAPTYADGEAEEKLGQALLPYRDDIFLCCKTHRHERAAARQDLETSLRRLHTDHFDLYLHHAVTTPAQVDQIFAPGGAAETMQEARAAGLIRYLGFSAHSVEAALLMLERGQFDAVLFPVNFGCCFRGNFGPQIIEAARRHGAARLAIKAMARTTWPEGAAWRYPNCWYEPLEDEALAHLALRFTLGEDITACIPPADAGLWRMALRLAQDIRPLADEERRHLEEVSRDLQPILEHAA